jgi:hypothetical protein
MKEQTAYGSVKCIVAVEHSFRVDELVPCGKPKARHKEGVKGAVLDHPFGGPDGTETVTEFPRCGACGKDVEKGTRYRSWTPRYGPAHYRHATCPSPPRSALTGSEILSTAWDIADQEVEVVDDAEAFDDQVSEIAEAIGDLVDLIQEKQDNLESGFGHTSIPAWEELDERRYEYEAWQQEVEGLNGDDFTDTDTDECAEDECGLSVDDHDDADHDFKEPFDGESARDALVEALGACPE